MKRVVLFTGVLGLGIAVLVPTGSAYATDTLANGFTAKVIAESGQRITGTIDASGFDLGIYIGPGVHDVTVMRATVSGANDEGILVQDASDVVIRDSSITGNAVDPFAGGTEVKGIVLAGTTNVVVSHNTVTGNEEGGIAVLDDGVRSQFAPDAIDTSPVAGVGNVVADNVVADNPNSCGIVLAGKNSGGGVMDNLIARNTVVGFNPAAHDFVPGAGGIVVAGGAGLQAPVAITDNVVLNNVVTGGFIAGVAIHAYGPGIITGTKVIGNDLSFNGEPEQPTGIDLFAVPHVGTIAGTQILHDSVANDEYGVFHIGDTDTHIVGLSTTDVTTPVGP